MTKTRAVPRGVVTDKLRSYGAARREVMSSVEQRSHKGLSNRAENSHRLARQRERAMKGLLLRRRDPAAPVRVQRRLTSPFRSRRHLMNASGHRAEMTIRFALRDRNTGAAVGPTTA
ncbi:hypothetical protein GCM10010446_67010 [Streptomyces enissocaesilis]|uniref:DDE domain-containing protein n=1 Tax=Streptomyces enissocaesilis TaxID=332589 RepID=A0ABN3XNH0_9ACTN